MSEDAHQTVQAMHARLAAGEDPDQTKIEDCRFVSFTQIELDADGTSATATLQIDELVLPEKVELHRDQAGKACMNLPCISFRVMTYGLYFLAPWIEAVCLYLADQILPKLKPFGFDRSTGKEITVHTPTRERLVEDLDEVRRKIDEKAFVWQAAP